MLKKSGKKILFLTVIILLAVLVFPHPVKATVAGVVADFLGFSFTSSTLGAIINGITTLILNLVEQAISFFAGLFDKFIQWQTNNAVYGVVVVDQSWTIIRNFVNMFFILILIIMAFGTIFDLPNYKWQHLLAPFLIAALLVNFSLTIGQYIITIANGLSGIFLKQIGQISGTFAQGFNAVGIATSGATDLISGTTKVLATSIFAIIFLSVVMLAFAAAAIFSLVRIFMLWFLLIISPIAWLGYSLPNLRSQTWGDWWKHFFCWCFFLPYYLFFVMFAVIFVKNRGTIPPVPGSDTTAGMTGTDFLFYALSLIFLIGGLVIARKMACKSGDGVRNVFGKIEAGVRRYAPGAGYVRAIGAGAKAGLQAKGEQIQEKGIPGIIGGAQAERLRQAKWTERFGFGAARGAADRAKAEEIEKESKKVKELNLDQRGLNERIQSTRGVERVAALKLKAENGWLASSDLDTINGTMRELGGGRTAPGASFLQSLRKGKFHEMAKSTDDKERILAGLEDLETKKAFALDMAESKEVMTEDLMKTILGLYKGETIEIQNKAKEALKKNVQNLAVGKTTAEKGTLLTKLGTIDTDLQKAFALDMAESKEIISEALATTILDMYKGESVEAKKKMDEALKNNIENFAKEKGDREILVTTSGDARIRKLAGQVMADKKEVDSWKLRRTVLEANGGIDPVTGDANTADGRVLAKSIDDSNVLFKEEAEYRKATPTRPKIPHDIDLAPPQRTEVHEQILGNIKAGYIKSFSAEELKTPEIFNALWYGLNAPPSPALAITFIEFKKLTGISGKGKPDREKRMAAEAIRTVAAPMAY